MTCCRRFVSNRKDTINFSVSRAGRNEIPKGRVVLEQYKKAETEKSDNDESDAEHQDLCGESASPTALGPTDETIAQYLHQEYF